MLRPISANIISKCQEFSEKWKDLYVCNKYLDSSQDVKSFITDRICSMRREVIVSLCLSVHTLLGGGVPRTGPTRGGGYPSRGVPLPGGYPTSGSPPVGPD